MSRSEKIANVFDPTSAKGNRQFLRNLDATIASFSDSYVSVESGITAIWGDNCIKQDNKIEIEENILKRLSPTGLEEPFKQLYSIIFPALCQTPLSCLSPAKNSNSHSVSRSESSFSSPFKTMVSASSAAILMGVKGSGKTLLLERVLAACHEQLQHYGHRLYRMVEINGIVCRGQDVGSVIYEIIRQLSGIAYRSIRKTKNSKSPHTSMIIDNDSISSDQHGRNKSTTHTSKANYNKKLRESETSFGEVIGGIESYNDIKHEEKKNRIRKRQHQRRKQGKIEKRLLRLRHATFNSNLSLLESILKLAAMDGIPILLNIDELDLFSDEGERQMLLYHFLDRVSTPGSNLILVAMTSSFSASTLLEKRIRSRAEGSAKIIYLRTPPTYESLLNLLRNKMKGCIVEKDILDRMPHPKDAEYVANALRSKWETCTKRTATRDNYETTENIVKLSNALEREFRFGKDIRWFSRLVSTSLTLYRHDCIAEMSRNICSTKENNATSGIPLAFCSKYIWNAMIMTGASVFENTAIGHNDLFMINNVLDTPRLQALLDLSQPQVALLLSARRILKREEHRDHAVLAPLTIDRMLNEYKSFSRGSTSIGNLKLLKQAVYHLVQQGLLVPSIDHSGGGPLHYDVTKIYRDLDYCTLLRLPLHVPFDMDRELGTVLDNNLLECSTALKEWGTFINKGN